MTKPRVAAIIQARMGSSRLPGKVLMPLAGKPVLWHIIYRLRKCRTVDVVAVATSDLPVDDELAAWCETQNVPVFRGPEDNVLRRYAIAVKALEPDIIIRICGDSPMVDPQTIDRLVNALLTEGAEHAAGEKGIDTIHEGFSPFTRAAFDRLMLEAADDPVAIEHVTAYFSEHPEKFQTARIPALPEHRFSGARMSIDTPADLRFMEELYSRLAVPPGEVDVADVVSLLRANQKLLQINSHVRQKKASDHTFKAIIRCDGDANIGMGHVVRCLALADELREGHSIGLSFAMTTGKPGIDMAKKAGFPVDVLAQGTSEDAWLDALIHQKNPHALILDIRTGLARDKIRHWRSKGLLIVTVDDPSDRRLEADLAFYSPVPQVKVMDWVGFTGQLFIGWEWVILRRQFAEAREKLSLTLQQSANTRASSAKNQKISILITMGGSDPAGLTLMAVRALGRTKLNFRATIVLGQAFAYGAQLKELLENTPFTYMILNSVKDMAQVMKDTDLAIASFGVTAYELAAMGVPTIYLCLTEFKTGPL